jgi:hypothetical protein
MKHTQTIPETFLGVGYTRDRAGLPLEAVRVPVPQPAANQVLIRVTKTVRRGGSWIVLGVGPGKTTRLVETHSPVDAILAERGASHVNVNLLRYFSEPATLDSEAQALLQRGMALAMEWAAQGLVVPHVSQTIDSTVEAINAGLQSLKAGRGILGKVAVMVDRDLAAGK